MIANAIVFYNTAILSRLLEKFEAGGNVKVLAVVKAAWQHVHLNGHYTFRGSGQAIDLEAVIQGLKLQ